MRLLTDADRYVWEGVHERNWLHRTNIALADAAGALLTYQVFFAVKRATREEARDVKMTVKSAYAFDPLRQPKVLDRAKIAGLLGYAIG